MARVEERARWEQALSAVPRSKGQRALRAYADAVNRGLLARWLPGGDLGRVLKTDLFEEALGEGLAPFLTTHAEQVDAIDVSETIVAEARCRHPGLRAICCDVRELPYEDGAFDAVVSPSTLDHFEAPAEIEVALRELCRVLRPGGLLAVSFDNPTNPLVALRNALPFSWLNRIGLVPCYVGATCGRRELRGMLARAGFDVRETTAVMHVPRVAVVALRPGVRRLRALERLERLPTRYLTGQFVAARAIKR